MQRLMMPQQSKSLSNGFVNAWQCPQEQDTLPEKSCRMRTLLILHNKADLCTVIIVQGVRHWSARHECSVRHSTCRIS